MVRQEVTAARIRCAEHVQVIHVGLDVKTYIVGVGFQACFVSYFVS